MMKHYSNKELEDMPHAELVNLVFSIQNLKGIEIADAELKGKFLKELYECIDIDKLVIAKEQYQKKQWFLWR